MPGLTNQAGVVTASCKTNIDGKRSVGGSGKDACLSDETEKGFERERWYKRQS